MNQHKKDRMATGLTMREYCLRNGVNPIMQSRLERDITGPLSDSELLAKLPALARIPVGNVDSLIAAVRNS